MSDAAAVPVDGVLLRIRLRTPYLLLLACGSLFGVAASFFVWKAQTLQGPLLINGLIELGPTGGTIFFAALAAVSLAFVATAVVVALRGVFAAPRFIELTDSELRVPTGRFAATSLALPRITLTGVVTTFNSNVFLVLHSGTVQASVSKNNVSKDDWLKLLDVVRGS